MQVSKREKVLLDPESGKIDSTFSVKDFFGYRNHVCCIHLLTLYSVIGDFFMIFRLLRAWFSHNEQGKHKYIFNVT
jgi:hypothetical protein